MKRKYVIWGCGFRGKYLADLLGADRVAALIDSNKELVNTECDGIKVIDFESYIKQYRKYAIIISPLKPYEIENFLIAKNVETYFSLLDCPGEFQGYGNFNFLKQINSSFSKDESVLIYGLNLFGILLYDHLKEHGIENISLKPHKNIRKEQLEQFTRLYSDIHIVDANEKVDRILNTVGDEDVEYIQKSARGNWIIENYFDFSDKIPEYYNKAIEHFHNCHQGERCFIVATGPSLRMEDLERLRKNREICFSMNRIYAAFDQTDWRPDYYVVTDRVALNEYWGEILDLDIKEKFISDRYIIFDSRKQKDLAAHSNMYRLHIPARGSIQGKIGFSSDCSKQCYEGGTVVYTCLQLAVYMGFKEIYLIGADCSYLGEKPTKNDYFISGYLPANRHTNPVQMDTMLAAYQRARDYTDSCGIKIYNSTRGGKLEVFERVDLDKIIS